MNYWARQQAPVSAETNSILDLTRERLPFAEWDQESREILSLALFPKKVSDENGRWTSEGRAALNLLRHLCFGANFMTAKEALRSPAMHMDDLRAEALSLMAFSVRRELILVTPPWVMDDLI